MTASANEVNESAIYAELLKGEINDDYEKILKISEKALKQRAFNEKLLHSKIVSLIRLSRFKEALDELAHDKPYFKNLSLEKAYCYYRLNNTEKALKTVRLVKEPSLALKELEAQILYRLERYNECFEVYRQVIKYTHDEYEDERAANLTAAIAFLIAEQPQREFASVPERTYEQLYNSACCLISKGRYGQAEKKLVKAEKMCRENMEEDGASEEEILEETALINGQRAYCLQMMGREKDAQSLYARILKDRPTDIGIVAIASNNSVAVSEDQNLFDMKKKLRSIMVEGLETKLTSKQNSQLALNQCLFALSINQNSLCLQLCAKLKEKYPWMEANAVVIEALLLSKQKKPDDAVKLLLDFEKQANPEDKLKMRLTAAQILLAQNNKKEACEVLEQLEEGIYEPGVVSLLVGLYNDLSLREKASKFLEQAVDWHNANKKDGVDITPLWKQIAEFHLQGGDPQIAVKSLQELLRIEPDNKKIVAKLVIAYAQFDEEKALEYSKLLPPVKTDDVNIETVLKSNWTTQTKLKKTLAKVDNNTTPAATAKSSKLAAATELINQEKKKKKRKKKIKLPKNYDPNAEPDPYRWLPKHERPGGGKKKRDRRIKDTGIGKGTQGAAGSSDQYDITKMAPSQPKPPSIPEGPRLQQRNRAVQHRRKKKGR